jgi:anti-sigma factor (TIGR02949 family)
MEPLNCAETFRRLDDYVDRELSPDELAAVEAHLEQCLICAGEFAVEHELFEQIRSKLQRVRMPPDLMARISARLNAP